MVTTFIHPKRTRWQQFMYDFGELVFPATALILYFGVLLLVWIGASRQEAAVYSRLTGHEVTTWDAMWVELRVQESPRN